MFKVECPGCKSSYNVDERRVPENTGMKMRCPRCQSSFVVRRPGEGAAPSSGATPPSSGGINPPSSGAPVPPSKKAPDLDLTVIRPRPIIAPSPSSTA